MTQVAAPRHRLLLLDDSVMLGLLKNPAVVNRFPFMRAVAQQVSAGKTAGCVPCGTSTNQAPVDLSGIRAAIDSMSPADKDALKVILSADRIRVFYKDHRGGTHKSTF